MYFIARGAAEVLNALEESAFGNLTEVHTVVRALY